MRIFLIFLSLVCSAPLLAEDMKEKHGERIERAMGEDRFAAGPVALISGAVGGDLILAGGDVLVVDHVDGDVVAAGGSVRIDADVGQNLYAAGGNVALNAKARRNARMAGGKIELGSQAGIAGNATLAGGNVVLLGNIEGHLAVAGGRVFLNGRVGGDVTASGGEIELGPMARIMGNLHYRSPELLKRDARAEVSGTVTRDAESTQWHGAAAAGILAAGAIMLLWVLGLMIIGAIGVAALPQFSMSLYDMARSRMGISLLSGLACLVATPIIASLLFVTGAGLPLGLLAMNFYAAILLLGFVSAGIIVGQAGLDRLLPARAAKKPWRIFATSLAILLLCLLIAIPVLGWVAWLTLWILGIGALLLQLIELTDAAAGPKSAQAR